MRCRPVINWCIRRIAITTRTDCTTDIGQFYLFCFSDKIFIMERLMELYEYRFLYLGHHLIFSCEVILIIRNYAKKKPQPKPEPLTAQRWKRKRPSQSSLPSQVSSPFSSSISPPRRSWAPKRAQVVCLPSFRRSIIFSNSGNRRWRPSSLFTFWRDRGPLSQEERSRCFLLCDLLLPRRSRKS